jgi:ATP-dependent DNA ligase
VVGAAYRIPAAGGLRPPVPLMAAAPIDKWPPGQGHLFEPKFDGWRACLFCLPDGVYLQSRTGRDLARYFPEIAAAVRVLPVGCVIDGELVIWNGDRTDFSLLQKRVASPRSPHPANLVGFDLLQHPSAGVLMHQPLTQRREALQHLLDGADARFALCPQKQLPRPGR